MFENKFEIILGYLYSCACNDRFLLCPVSPSVITPPMVELMEAGYGEEKNIGVLIHGAAGLDVAFSVSVFDICLALLFRRSMITHLNYYSKIHIKIRTQKVQNVSL